MQRVRLRQCAEEGFAARRRYVDFPITDVLQMMGRAGRPQYDKHGVAVIMVAEPKKSFYKKCAPRRAMPDTVVDSVLEIDSAMDEVSWSKSWAGS